ncbi:MAG: hypothetical protein OEW68_07780 [Gammaproteobacteria bacterium]|nr:hypothetical protein [Gammaproteobacteria bacterium]MDH5212742.1 hypothetical protein [Gammaproteobacteria bacterium]MDH5501814.1 hypothetical protein [Gammaproteobacteria bacterium]
MTRTTQHTLSMTGRIAMIALLITVPSMLRPAFAAPGDILFRDTFERAALAPWTTTNALVSGIMTGPQVSSSPTRGAFTSNLAVTITSPTFNAAVPAAELRYWVRRGSDAFSEDTDAGEDLVLEYRRADGSWGQVATYPGGGVNGEIIQGRTRLPLDARHGALAIRARQTNGSGPTYDFWHLDDVVVTEVAPPPPIGIGQCDAFENGLIGNWTVAQSGGFAGTNNMTAQSPDNSLFLNGGVVTVTSVVINTSVPSFTNLTMWIRRGADAFSEDPDNGDNFVVEYFNTGGTWTVLEQFNGSGQKGQIFLRTYNLPANGRHVNFRLRFRQTNGSGQGYDYWHVDDVCFVQTPVPALLVSKFSQTLSDPFNGSSNPKAIPGATILYTVNVANQGNGTVDSNSLIVTDPVPANTALFVSTSAGPPISFVDGPIASGLSYVYATNVSYSNQPGGGPPYSYTPVPDAQGFDPAVTGTRIALGGAMNAAAGSNTPSFSLLLRLRVQ